MMTWRIPALGLTAVVALAACSRSEVPGADGDKRAAPAWRAEAAMISNVGVYRGHEFVYQDYIYDDHGANTDGKDRFDAPLGTPGPDPDDPINPRFSPAPLINYAGDFTYAAPDGKHMANVADLIEFRVAADAKNVYFHFRLGDMTAPDSTVIGICVDEDNSLSTGLAAWPLGANLNEQLGCDHFYTVYGTGAQVTDAAGTKDLVEEGGAVSADVDEATMDVSIPRSVADPGNGTWRIYAGSGLWDATSGAWAAPTPLPSAAGAPITTGGNPRAPNIWDLLSNNHEPNSTWDEEKQANDLSAHTILDDYLDVDFGRLASGRDDPDPELTGVVVRIYHSQNPTDIGRGIDTAANRTYQGPWQPYVAVIPHSYYEHPGKQYPFDQCLHPLGTNHLVEVFYAEAFADRTYDPVVTGVTPATGYLGFSQIEALIDRLDGVYACVLGRGEGVGYQGGDGLVDALEVREDMLKRYRVDPDRNTVHGVSLGAIGSWYVGRLYPDRYAAVMPYIFTADITGGVNAQGGSAPTLANLYNVPVFYSIGTGDQFGQGTQGDLVADEMTRLGNEYLYLHFLARQHEGRIENDFLPFVLKLAYTRTLVRDPARVVYVLDPADDFSPKVPFDGRVYWASGIEKRDAAAVGKIDVTSLARADQLPSHQVVLDAEYANDADLYTARMRGLFRLTQDEFDALWHPEIWQPGWTELSKTVTPTDLEVPPVSNGFTLTASNLKSVTLDAGRMKLRGNAHYSVQTDGAIEIRLSDGRRLSLPAAGTYEGNL